MQLWLRQCCGRVTHPVLDFGEVVCCERVEADEMADLKEM